jgi:hypothetical protein
VEPNEYTPSSSDANAFHNRVGDFGGFVRMRPEMGSFPVLEASRARSDLRKQR